MSSDESRLILFQSDWCIRVKMEVMNPSCIEVTVQTFRGSVIIWDCLNRSVWAQQRYVAKIKMSADDLNVLYRMIRLSHQWSVSSLNA